MSSVPSQCVTGKLDEIGSLEKGESKKSGLRLRKLLLISWCFHLEIKQRKVKGRFKEMKTYALLGAIALIASSASAQNPGFTGFSVVRVFTAEGNSVYSIYGNWNASNAIMLNAFDANILPGFSGMMNARHQDSAETPEGEPSSSWSASTNLAGTIARNNDSWVTASGSGTSGGNGTALDPSFTPDNLSYIPTAAGWYDATPGTVNPVLAGTLGGHAGQNATGGFQMLLAQIARTGNDSTNGMGLCVTTMKVGFKAAGATSPLFGQGSFTIGVPTPGALALLGLAGAFGRRRRS